ncbi:hypothetical protein AAFO92_03775 [Roseovarius sp. CAU 1744]|uniref:hypothetical protein n=1 Tax=Roseovarius sp. CAU 1744 TaxID=3140368 RepID=UPI00325A642F
MSHLLSTGVAALTLTLLAGCEPKDTAERVDLVPARAAGSQGPGGFCIRDSQGLSVRVRNQSNIDALQVTQTRVRFETGAVVTLPTAPMPGGSFAVTGPFPIPAGCFNPDCGFEITVNVTGTLPNEVSGNNTESGICIG